MDYSHLYKAYQYPDPKSGDRAISDRWDNMVRQNSSYNSNQLEAEYIERAINDNRTMQIQVSIRIIRIE
jgi:hypothetical protein